ncbi:unnamed protein product [Ilex paraguariensis]|uniref:Uncharacterized protein n=1 Tax=Ilex paraguariensis TaxID=185542 RepID=A0ABC8U5Q8_9AQUA
MVNENAAQALTIRLLDGPLLELSNLKSQSPPFLAIATMSLSSSRSFQWLPVYSIITFMLLFLPQSNSVSFNFSSFQPNTQGIFYQGDAFPSGGVIQVTKNQRDGKASKESDVYSFGVVALELACGRRPVELRAEPAKVRLVEWVWDLYGRGQLLSAADNRLIEKFEERQIECLMVVGLWCCHPDHNHRPSMKQVINVLNFEAPLPSLPSKLPVPMFFAPPMHMCRFSYTSSGGLTDSGRHRSQCSCSSCSTQMSVGSSKALLQLPEVHV